MCAKSGGSFFRSGLLFNSRDRRPGNGRGSCTAGAVALAFLLGGRFVVAAVVVVLVDVHFARCGFVNGRRRCGLLLLGRSG